MATMKKTIERTWRFAVQFRDSGDAETYKGGHDVRTAYVRLVKGVLAYERVLTSEQESPALHFTNKLGRKVICFDGLAKWMLGSEPTPPPPPLFKSEEERKAARVEWEEKFLNSANGPLISRAIADRIDLLADEEVYLNQEIIKLYDDFFREVENLQKRFPHLKEAT